MRAEPTRGARPAAPPGRGTGRPAALAALLAGVVALAPALGAAGPRGAARDSHRGRPRAAPRVPGITHVVAPGDTLWGIAREHGVPLPALLRANGLARNARIRVGQRLAIPLMALRPGSQEPPSLADIVLEPPTAIPAIRLVRPVPGAVLSPFGPRGAAWHGGIDLQADRGTPIRAAAAGTVIASGWERGYGHVVKVWHGSDLVTVYAHNLENLVKVGAWVEAGEVIATVGGTGRATAPHLHFEVRLDGRKYDPLHWLPAGETVQAATVPFRGTTPSP